MQTLERRLGIPAATAIGVASMLGAGVFFVWAPATAAAGPAVVLALPLAAVIAALNAATTTRLAMRHPVSGGAYAYGRAELGPLAGFVAGVLFLLGKTASVAAIALIAGAYLLPDGARWVAAGLVVVLAGLNATGVRATAAVSAAAGGIVVVALLVFVTAGLGRGGAVELPAPAAADLAGVLPAAALIFFAFAGYARIATLGEEVREPGRTLPRAVIAAVAIVFALSVVVLGALLLVLGPERLAASTQPVAELAGSAWAPVVAIAAAVACVGSLTGVLAGLSRTALAMARDHELPGSLAVIARRTATPVVADAVVACVAVLAVLLLDPARVVGISACSVLGYYAIGHLSALRAGRSLGLARGIPIAGLIGCLVVGASTPWQALLGVIAVTLVAVAGRALARRVRRG